LYRTLHGKQEWDAIAGGSPGGRPLRRRRENSVCTGGGEVIDVGRVEAHLGVVGDDVGGAGRDRTGVGRLTCCQPLAVSFVKRTPPVGVSTRARGAPQIAHMRTRGSSGPRRSESP
jgi:hypothetical protein